MMRYIYGDMELFAYGQKQRNIQSLEAAGMYISVQAIYVYFF